MKIKINFPDAQNQNKIANIEIPKKCPICGLLGNISHQSYRFSPDMNSLQLVYMCPNDDCRSFFITYYQELENNEYEIHKHEPPELSTTVFPDFVKELSSKFLSIYKQANEARERGLDEIAGVGYRKAFEFLIKDYAKSLDPEDNERNQKIDDAFAGKVVNDHIPDPRVQAVARRALWLGNDETHYIKKWVDYNVTDLIKLIDLTIDWIEIERDSKEYVEAMKEEEKKKAIAKKLTP
jgi:hypothetical protein